MLAYQMIYTACGPDRKGAFDLWAKSANVTKEEWTEIEKVMGYKKPRNLPYEATEQEIEQMCPKKYAYIKLRSGRKCLARSNYIGKVYSDEDSRSGNFIIHAYIFDDLGSLRPSCVFTLPNFKSKLTYKEWHDDPVPTDLPMVEITGNLTNELEGMLRTLISGKKEQIASLLQAVINMTSENKTIAFNADEKTQELIYHLINCLLPKRYYENATFCTRYLANSDFTFSSDGLEPIRIRNILQDGIGTFNYEEELNVGEKYVFSFDENIYSTVIPGNYVKTILDVLVKGSLFDAMKKAEEIGLIADKAGCDLDTALSIYQIKIKNFAYFKDADTFWKAYERAAAYGYANKEVYVPLIYVNIIKTRVWGYNSSTIALTKYVFENSDVAIKDEIIDDYYVNMQSYGVQMSTDPAVFLNSVKACAPFDWNDFGMSLVRKEVWKTRIESANTAPLNYLFFDTILGIVESGNNPRVTNEFSIYLLNIARKAIIKKDFNEIKLYWQRGKMIEDWLIQNLADEIFGRAHVQEDMEFALKFIIMLNSTQKKCKLMEKLFTINMAAQFFLETYIKYAQENQSLFADFEKTVEKNPVFTSFFLKKEAYVFKNDKNITFEKLEKYFNKYYKIGNDSGIYYLKLQEYIRQLPQKTLLNECLKLYTLTRGLDNNFPDLKNIIAFLGHEIYSLSTDDLMKASLEQQTLLKELEMRARSLGVQISSRLGVIETLSLIQGKSGKTARRQAILNGSLYSSIQSNDFATFINSYMPDILEAYLEEVKANQKNQEIDTLILVKGIFEPIFANANMDFSGIIKALERINKKEYYKLMTEFSIYAFYKKDSFAAQLQHFLKVYVEQMKRGAWKKLFRKVEDILETYSETPEEEFLEIYNWFETYRETHKGIFDILFGKREKPAKNENKEQD